MGLRKAFENHNENSWPDNLENRDQARGVHTLIRSFNSSTKTYCNKKTHTETENMNKNISSADAEDGNSLPTTLLTNRHHFPSSGVFQIVPDNCFSCAGVNNDACRNEPRCSGIDFPHKLTPSKRLDTRNSHHNQSAVGQRLRFPQKLHSLLQEMTFSGRESIVSWQPHGLSFRVHDRKEFETNILPLYFNHTNITSFRRQLCLYSFERIKFGIDKDAYHNDMFLRDHPHLCEGMETTRNKKNEGRKPYHAYQDSNHCDFVQLNSNGMNMREKDDSDVSQARACKPREDLFYSDSQLTLPSTFFFENDATQPFSMASRSEHNYIIGARGCAKYEAELQDEDLFVSSAGNVRVSAHESKLRFYIMI